MFEIRKKLQHSEVTWGLLLLAGLPRDFLPQPNYKVVVLDADGEIFRAKMHSAKFRIDGLTKLHQKHHTFIGQTVTLEVDPSKPGILKISFSG